MPDKGIAQLRTKTSHGTGRMITASKLVFGDAEGMCGVGDLVSGHKVGKPYHPPNPVVTGSKVTFIDDNDRPVARVGDKLKCGAVLLGTDIMPNVFTD